VSVGLRKADEIVDEIEKIALRLMGRMSSFHPGKDIMGAKPQKHKMALEDA
ncbi:7711_t:CDS:1, partial [Gigaspora rosea]